MAGRARVRRCPRAVVPLALLSLVVTILSLPTASAGTPTCAGAPATEIGTGDDDVLRGTAGRDVFLGRGGDDRLIGRGGDDVFCAGPGNDVVKGGGGDDLMRGQGGNDVLVGGPGADTLLGGGGDDELNGGDGDDELNGGRGTDQCTQGETLSGCESPTPEFEVDGSWAGTTSQDLGISFDVEAHELTTLSISYSWAGPGCTSEGNTTIQFTNGLEIVNNQFDYESSAGTLDLQVHGTFTSDTASSGTFSVADSSGFCPGSASGTWDAAKA